MNSLSVHDPKINSESDGRPLISFVVPVLNEEANIEKLYQTVTRVMATVESSYRYEILFTDNHSEDNTFRIASELSRNDSRVRVLRFSRNFGFQASILTGYLNARGDAVIQLDCDLQDPPILSLEFLKCWEQGYKVVYGIREKRQEGIGITLLRKVFYRFLTFLSDYPIPVDAGDFRLVDRCIIEEIRKINDATPYLRGMVACLGFEQIGIPYARDARTAGHSKFRFSDLTKLAVDGILNHSVVPLRLGTMCSQVIFLAVVLVVFGYCIARLTIGNTWPAGFTTLSVLVLFSTGLNALLLGIQGEYIGRIFKQVKQFPTTVIEQREENCESADVISRKVG